MMHGYIFKLNPFNHRIRQTGNDDGRRYIPGHIFHRAFIRVSRIRFACRYFRRQVIKFHISQPALFPRHTLPYTQENKVARIQGLETVHFHIVYKSSIHCFERDSRTVSVIYLIIVYADVSLDSLSQVPELPAKYPEFSMFRELPAWGIYIRHAENIQCENVELFCHDKDYRTPVVMDDVHESAFISLKTAQPGQQKEWYANRSCTGISVR